MMAWRKKDVLGETEGRGLREKVSSGLGVGGPQNGVASSSGVLRGVTVRTKIDGEWQQVVGKRQGLGVGMRRELIKDDAVEAGTRFDVLQPQSEIDSGVVGDGGISVAKSKDVRDDRVPLDKELHDYRILELKPGFLCGAGTGDGVCF
ncbi:hypothetical protein Dimus_023734 [Dionaea muscipula]